MRKTIARQVLRLKILSRLKREFISRSQPPAVLSVPLKIERADRDHDGPNWRVRIGGREEGVRYRMAWARVRKEFEDDYDISDG
jgi:hypothetical protein